MTATAGQRIGLRTRSTQRTVHECDRRSDGHCDNRWICPQCTPRLARHRAWQIDKALERHRADGGGVVMLTVTVEHRPNESLASSWAKLDATRNMWKGRSSEHLRDGVLGRIIGTHVIWTVEGGWHPHHHQLLLTYEPWGDVECADFIRRVGDWFKRSRRKTQPRSTVPSARPLPVPSSIPGVDWDVRMDVTPRKLDDGEYLANPEQHYPWKVKANDTEGRQSWTPLQLVHEADAAGGWSQWHPLAWEAQTASHGRAPIMWSPGLSAWFGTKGSA